MKTFKKMLVVLLVAMIILPSSQVAYASEAKADMEFLYSVLKMIEARYPFEIDEDTLIKGGVKGMLRSVDPYSDYYTKEEAKNLMNITEGQIVGIGVVVEIKDGGVNIKEVLEGSPAKEAGLKNNDKIVSIDDESLIGLTLPEVSYRIKGDLGSKVKITIARGKEFKDFTIERKEIKINPVEFKILDGNIGYLAIDEFSHGLSEYTDEAFREMDKKGVKKLILDLRNNPGGLLTEAVSLSNRLIPSGDIVHIRYNGKLETIKSTLSKKKYDLVVLVNGNSASASEIVAGAVKDRKAGRLVGTKTYGKATVQSLMPITDGSIVKLTIAEYLTPSRKSINKIGIEPDIEVKITGQKDTQLEKAIELLK